MSDDRIFSPDECARIIDRVLAVTQGGGATQVTVVNYWTGELRWSHNQATLASDRRDVTVLVHRKPDGANEGRSQTNQLDDVSLEAAVRCAEREGQLSPVVEPGRYRLPSPSVPVPNPTLWSDATFGLTAAMRSDTAHRLVQGAEAHTLVASGFLRAYASSVATRRVGRTGDENDMDGVQDAMRQSQGTSTAATGSVGANTSAAIHYQRYSVAECSMTVRNANGTASGWAGRSGFDWNALGVERLATDALQLCLDSANPVAVEPGRFTVILRPQAVFDFLAPLMYDGFARDQAESGIGPFVLGQDEALNLVHSKLGLKIADERVTIHHDPMDPVLGILAGPGLEPVTWIDHGILKTLTYERNNYALPKLNDNLPALKRKSFRMDGGDATLEQMIAGTERGLVVTRFSNLITLEKTSYLSTGFTRDGLFLVERGKITKSVKNMRFTESPLFLLNNLDQLGAPVEIFAQYRDEPASALVPPIKAHDFSFTALADAV